ncbi:MAG: flavodoxin family protein [Desulfobaccales bacterium]
MKIVAVLGSPRAQSNSSTLARTLLTGAAEQGAETKEFLLNRMDFQGCQGCGGCKTKSETCMKEDELSAALEEVKAADVLVLASPVYFGDISGQMKCFFDRTYSYLNPDFSSRVPQGKQAVVILVQANPDDQQFNDIFPRYERWLKLYGYDPVHLLRVTGVREPGVVKQHAALMERVATLARQLANRPVEAADKTPISQAQADPMDYGRFAWE